MTPDMMLAVQIAGTSVLAAVAALALMGAFHGRHGRRDGDLFGVAEEQTVFLFDGQDLVDATDSARALLAGPRVDARPWTRLMSYLAPHFPNAALELADLASRGQIMLTGGNGHSLQLRAEIRRGLTRIALVDPEAEGARITLDRLSHRAMEEELLALRTTMDHTPLPIWREQDGAVTWANPAYLDLVRAIIPADEGLTWPLPRLFDAPQDGAGGGAPWRCRVRGEGEGATWFDLITEPSAAGTLHYALPAEATVKAETALRNFVQTLAKTFAHLPTGLAIFNRDRQLVLFNPALTDLTALGVDFLSARPTLTAFFDRLREGRMIPEPKDYKEWRRRISDLEKAAATGQYQETWTLPTGQTYRVTGRPHPDGAVAFLIDDISAEMAMTRRFRSDLETGQAVIDTLDSAMAVFSSAGVLVMSNAAYGRLWGIDPGARLGEVGLQDAMGHWQARGGNAATWAGARACVLGQGLARPDWIATIDLEDGTRLDCRFQPIAGGATLARFSPVLAGSGLAGGVGAEVVAGVEAAGSGRKGPDTQGAVLTAPQPKGGQPKGPQAKGAGPKGPKTTAQKTEGPKDARAAPPARAAPRLSKAG
jgi:PAS domain-containing protein